MAIAIGANILHAPHDSDDESLASSEELNHSNYMPGGNAIALFLRNPDYAPVQS